MIPHAMRRFILQELLLLCACSRTVFCALENKKTFNTLVPVQQPYDSSLMNRTHPKHMHKHHTLRSHTVKPVASNSDLLVGNVCSCIRVRRRCRFGFELVEAVCRQLNTTEHQHHASDKH